jgi:hypothetical protein
MKTSDIVSLAGSFAICLSSGANLFAANDTIPNSSDSSRSALVQRIQPASGVSASSIRASAVTAAAVPAQLPAPLPQLPGGGTPPPVPGAPAAPAAAAPAAAPAVAPQRTIWGFLGIPSCDKIHEACAKLKLLLGVPPAPAALGSAEALNSPNAAVAAAAGAKAEQDAKPAKIKAIRYLAKLDNACCYPGTKDALLKALDDCDWEVRREAALAFGKACCCDEKVIERLKDIVNTTDKFGNYKEPIDDVRCAAEKSLNLCMCRCPAKYTPEKLEAPKPETPAESKEAPAAASREPIGRTVTGMLIQPSGNTLLLMDDFNSDSIELVTGDRALQAEAAVGAAATSSPRSTARLDASKVAVWTPPFHGAVSTVDKKTGLAYVNRIEGELPATGARAQLYHKYPLRTVLVGEVEVVGITEDEQVLVRPAGAMTYQQIKKGDKLVIREQE